MGRSKGL